ncbi:MAG: hypothetical protein WCY39_00050 [Oscillospiraceae bacterium]
MVSDPTTPEATLAPLLLESLEALAVAGEVDRACRIAGRACVALRHADPGASRRIDAWLHRQIRRLDW